MPNTFVVSYSVNILLLFYHVKQENGTELNASANSSFAFNLRLDFFMRNSITNLNKEQQYY